MIVNLPLLARESGVRRKTKSTPYEPPKTLENELLAVYMDTVKIWRGVMQRVLDTYERPEFIISDSLSASPLAAAAEDFDNTILYQTAKLGRWVRKVGAWNGQKIISAAKSATGVEIAPYMRLIDVEPQLSAAIRENVALLKNLNAQTQARVEFIISDSIVNRRNKKYLTKELSKALGVTQRRARLIAGDQTHKLNVALTSIRNQQLGISKFEWVTRRDEKVRHLHRTYNGKEYRWDKPPADGLPGWPINCRCVARSIFWDNEDDG